MNARVIVSMLRDALVPIVLGKNPLDIDRLWDEMYHRTYKLGVMGAQPEAMSGIDIALWDILGKVTGLPLWQLFGGKRKDRIRMYSSIGGGAQATVAEQVRKAVNSVSQGFTALKMRMDWSSRVGGCESSQGLGDCQHGAERSGRQDRSTVRRQQWSVGQHSHPPGPPLSGSS